MAEEEWVKPAEEWVENGLRYSIFEVPIPDDFADTDTDIIDQGIHEAREGAAEFVMPAQWSGRIARREDWDLVVEVKRVSLAPPNWTGMTKAGG